MKQVLLFASISLASGLLFTNVYTSIVDAASWGSDFPGSIATAREYFRNVSPGNFFRIFSPLNQVLALLVLIAFWKVSPTVRLCLGAVLILYVACDVFTFAFFYPRNSILFETGSLTNTDLLKKVWSQWNSMNWIRSLILVAGLVLSFISLQKIYFQQRSRSTVSVSTARLTETAIA